MVVMMREKRPQLFVAIREIDQDDAHGEDSEYDSDEDSEDDEDGGNDEGKATSTLCGTR